MSSTPPTDPLPSGISLYGGLPVKNQDLGGSIVFVVVFALIIPLAIFRVIMPSRTFILFRPCIFIGVAIGLFVVRIVQCEGTYTDGTFIAELILFLAGFNILCEPIVALLERNLQTSAVKASQTEPEILVLGLKLLRLALIAALVLGIYTGTQYGSDISPSKVDDINKYRKASSALTLVVVCLTFLLGLIFHPRFKCDIRATAFIAVQSAFLIITAAYRLYVSTQQNQNPVSVSTKLQFYLLGGMFEWFVCVGFFIFNLRELFDMDYEMPASGIVGRVSNFYRGKPSGGTPAYSTHPQTAATDPESAYAHPTIGNRNYTDPNSNGIHQDNMVEAKGGMRVV